MINNQTRPAETKIHVSGFSDRTCIKKSTTSKVFTRATAMAAALFTGPRSILAVMPQTRMSFPQTSLEHRNQIDRVALDDLISRHLLPVCFRDALIAYGA
jgi:hypothetical protein